MMEEEHARGGKKIQKPGIRIASPSTRKRRAVPSLAVLCPKDGFVGFLEWKKKKTLGVNGITHSPSSVWGIVETRDCGSTGGFQVAE